jgi:aldehyde:ferredoxin oxidoreductase
MTEEYGAKVLRVDLSRGEIELDELNAAALRKYIGGYALGARYLYEEVPPGVEWSDPENRLMFLAGVLSGTLMPGSGGITVCAKGAMTGGAAATQAQGDFGAYLKRSGLLGIVVHGASQKWTYLVIDEEGEAELRDAEHLVGKDTWETVDALVEELGRKEREVSMFSIGPAGENLVRWAGVLGNRGHAAMHNGVGAVMGSKKLKAVAVLRGRKRVRVADRDCLRSVADKLMEPVKASKDGVHYHGSLQAFHKNYERSNLPVKNYTTTVWDVPEETYEKFSGPYINEHFEPRRPRGCWACPNRHCQMLTITEGPYAGMEVEEPEYEQLSAFSANLGIDEIGSVMMLANTVDRLGVDTNEAGWVCSCVMECFERGILTAEDLDGLEMTWGAVEATRELLHKIAQREGVGDLLAEGVRRATEEIGGEARKVGIYTMKGATPRGHDHRARWTEMFDHCVSETGALENSLNRVDLTQYGLPSNVHPYDPNMLAKTEAKMKGAMQLEDSVVTCRYNTNMNVELMSQAISAVTGWDFDFDDGLEVGRRAVNTMRAFNIRHGVSAEEKPSPRYGSTPKDGGARGKSIMPHIDQMLQIYYDYMGWDEEGKPLPETLKDLGLEEISSDLWGDVD